MKTWLGQVTQMSYLIRCKETVTYGENLLLLIWISLQIFDFLFYFKYIRVETSADGAAGVVANHVPFNSETWPAIWAQRARPMYAC